MLFPAAPATKPRAAALRASLRLNRIVPRTCPHLTVACAASTRRRLVVDRDHNVKRWKIYPLSPAEFKGLATAQRRAGCVPDAPRHVHTGFDLSRPRVENPGILTLASKEPRWAAKTSPAPTAAP